MVMCHVVICDVYGMMYFALQHNVTHKYHDHKVHLSTMLIPYVLGDTSLPVIVTEEDILWVPQADRRIDEVKHTHTHTRTHA